MRIGLTVDGRPLAYAGRTRGKGWTVIVGDEVLWRSQCCDGTITMVGHRPKSTPRRGVIVSWGRCYDNRHLRGVMVQALWNPPGNEVSFK